MGPVIVFDKSTLESLNSDEAMWLDQFFNSNITPLFYIETLADLEKEVRRGRTSEAVVGSLAHRTPDYSSRPNTHHLTLLEAELTGGVELDLEYGRPNLIGGRRLELDGKAGTLLAQTPEEEAIARWRRGEFLDLERLQARQWREAIAQVDLGLAYTQYQRFFPIGKPRTLSGVKALAEAQLNAIDAQSAIGFGLSLVGVHPVHQQTILKRWREAGRAPMRSFAPYLYHVTLVDLFFYTAIAADLIGRVRTSNRVDMAYLYYLPFCMVFSSNDRLHAQVVPLFLRENQSFVLGSDLKDDLGKLDAHYDALPSEVKARGVISFAPHPPLDGDFLVSGLWDKHMSPTWRERRTDAIKPSGSVARELAAGIKRFVEEGKPLDENSAPRAGEADYFIVQRLVRRRMGQVGAVHATLP